MHLGHVVNAIYVWGMARAHEGEVLLRIEDHDRIRSRPEFETALLDDLDWLGFVPDAGRRPVVRQSDDTGAYEEALGRLRLHHPVYACACSRKDIGSERYDGRCRELAVAEMPGRGLRVRMESGIERFDDLRLGATEQVPAAQCGDLLLRDRDGHWTYQFAVTVDDLRQDITHVIRGEDLMASTGRQMALARMLGRTTPPAFLHHPLITRPDGTKLSKSAIDTGIRQLRAAGLKPEEVIGRAAAMIDLITVERPVPASEVAALFR
jgi:glutamyl/glutaminyl-tRNA synthetase